MNYENKILERQESICDECTTCPHKGKKCTNQCMEITYVYNPVIGIEREKR